VGHSVGLVGVNTNKGRRQTIQQYITFRNEKICNNMKKIRVITALFSVILGMGLMLSSCTKQTSGPVYSVASLNVINALPTSAPLILVQGNISSTVGMFAGIGTLSYAGIAVLTPRSGSETLVALQRNADTASVTVQGGHYMFSSELSFSAGGFYSLYITGADTISPDYLFVQDTVTKRTDSTAGIRFVNLSTGSNPVSVDIKGQANGSVVVNLAYKGITNFMSFPATSAISSYIFEFRDATSGNLLASYTLNGVNTDSPTIANMVLFKNLTIALIGQPTGGTVAQNCILVNNGLGK
jgi:hypothetical protein